MTTPRHFSNISIDPEASQTPTANRVKTHFEAVTTSADKQRIAHYRDGKRELRVTAKKGETMDTCATIHDQYVCCNVKVLKSVKNCPFDCSYCFLQNYLNDGTTEVVGQVDQLMNEVKERTQAQPWRLFRIGTWELGDSLALESETGQASELIERFKEIPNALLELKTKSANVDPILKIDHGRKTVVSWSLNPEQIINEQEHRTARLSERVEAIKKVSDAGYLIGFHFDPMIWYEGWEAGYEDLIKRVFEVVNPDLIAWISIGSLRFNPEMKRKMEENFPKNQLSLAEMILGDDGKVRYVKPLRLKMYRFLYDLIRQHGNDDMLVYFCMERWDIWEKITGFAPRGIGHLDYLFAQSLAQRFPDVVSKPASVAVYEAFQNT